MERPPATGHHPAVGREPTAAVAGGAVARLAPPPRGATQGATPGSLPQEEPHRDAAPGRCGPPRPAAGSGPPPPHLAAGQMAERGSAGRAPPARRGAEPDARHRHERPRRPTRTAAESPRGPRPRTGRGSPPAGLAPRPAPRQAGEWRRREALRPSVPRAEQRPALDSPEHERRARRAVACQRPSDHWGPRLGGTGSPAVGGTAAGRPWGPARRDGAGPPGSGTPAGAGAGEGFDAPSPRSTGSAEPQDRTPRPLDAPARRASGAVAHAGVPDSRGSARPRHPRPLRNGISPRRRVRPGGG